MANSAIGFKIRERRKVLGLTQSNFAKTLGISGSYLNLIEANKRAVGGELLERIAGALDVEVENLTGMAEKRLMDDLSELSSDPLIRHLKLGSDVPIEFVGRFPAWARAMLTVFRAYLDSHQTAVALSDRMNRDPFLSDTVHQMLTHITAIRSTSEILENAASIDGPQRARFQSIITTESAQLSSVARSLATFFDKDDTQTRSRAIGDEIDDFLIERRSFFPILESAAEDLGRAIRKFGASPTTALVAYLEGVHSVTVANHATSDTERTAMRNMCMFDAETRSLVFLDNAPAPTRRFQLARLAAEIGARAVIDEELEDADFSSPATRRQGFRVLSSYLASALLFPYDSFLDDATRTRYDIENLSQRYEASFEQICHRLVTLRRESAAGIPFAFLRTDVAGYATKRLPLPDFPLPRHGHACPLWAIFTAFQTPGHIVRQVAEFPDRSRSLAIARSVTKQPATFHEPRTLRGHARL